MTAVAGRPSRPARRRVRGTLLLLAGLMLVSGAIRLGTGVGEALTRDAPEAPDVVAPAPDLGPLLAALQDREARVAAREAALEERLQALALAELAITRQTEALTVAEQRLAATLAMADQAAERDLERLTAVYEAMKPAEAAALFEEMDPQFAAGFLARMRPEAAAAIFSGLDPRLAYTVSVILAGRHAGVPTE